MSPARLRELRTELRLSSYELAELTGYTRSAVQGWETGKSRVPAPVAAWLEALAAAWRAHPPPRRA